MHLFSHPASTPATAPARRPPTHVTHWTGRAALTLPLPSLAALRLHGGTLPREPAAAAREPEPSPRPRP